MKFMKYLFFASACILFATNAWADSYVAVEDTTTIYSSPSYQSMEVVKVYPGLHLGHYGDRDDGWSEVRIHTDNKRYVRTGAIKRDDGYEPPNYKNYELSEICRIKREVDNIDEVAIDRTEEILESKVAEEGYETNEISNQRLKIEGVLIDRLIVKHRKKGNFDIDPIGIEKMLLEAMQPLELWNSRTCT